MKDNLDDLIADYLLDKLDPMARTHFEQRLAAEPDLAARVALERDVAAALNASSPENQLRANLRQISDKYDSPESLDPALGESASSKARLWWVLAVGVLVLGGLAYYNLQQAEKPTMPLPPQPSLESPITNPPTTNPPVTNPPITHPPPIAANFKPIPKLESYIGSQVRSGALRVRVDEPRSSSILPTRTGKTDFRLSGQIEGKVPAGAVFEAMIFNNDLQHFDAMRPIESYMLELDSNRAFVFQKRLSMAVGLYYLLVEEQQSGEWVFVGKFLVK